MLVRDLFFHRTVRFAHVVGIGGIGTGVVFALQENHTLGREESRPADLLPSCDYCKLHIVEHYIAALMRPQAGEPLLQIAAIGVIGSDEAGNKLLPIMQQAGIDTTWIRRSPNHRTLYSVCFVYPDGSGGNITASNSASSLLGLSDLRKASSLMQKAKDRCVALCLPEVPLEIRQDFLSLATEFGNFRVASLTRAEISLAKKGNFLSMVDLLSVNIEEAEQIVEYGYSPANKERFLQDCSTALSRLQPAMQIIVSAGAEGLYAFEGGRWNNHPAPHVSVASTAGAGDALLAGILCGLSAGLPLTGSRTTQEDGVLPHIKTAADLGLLLASFSVTSPHTIHFGANLETLMEFASSLAPATF